MKALNQKVMWLTSGTFYLFVSIISHLNHQVNIKGVKHLILYSYCHFFLLMLLSLDSVILAGLFLTHISGSSVLLKPL